MLWRIILLFLLVGIQANQICIQEWSERQFEERAHAFLPLPNTHFILALRKNNPHPLWIVDTQNETAPIQPAITTFQDGLDPPLMGTCSHAWIVKSEEYVTTVDVACPSEILTLALTPVNTNGIVDVEVTLVDRQPLPAQNIASSTPFVSDAETSVFLISDDQSKYYWVEHNASSSLSNIEALNMSFIPHARRWLFKSNTIFSLVMAVDETGITQMHWDRSNQALEEQFSVTQLYAGSTHPITLDIIDADIAPSGQRLVVLLRILRNNHIETVASEWVLSPLYAPQQQQFALADFSQGWTTLFLDHVNYAAHIFAPEGRKMVIQLSGDYQLTGLSYSRRLVREIASPITLIENEDARSGIPTIFAYAPEKGVVQVMNWGESQNASRLDTPLSMTTLELNQCPQDERASSMELTNPHLFIVLGSFFLTCLIFVFGWFKVWMLPSPNAFFFKMKRN